MSETVINKDLGLVLIEEYDVISLKSARVVRHFNTKDEAENFIKESPDPNSLYIDFLTNKEIVNRLNEKYNGCKLYSVEYKDGTFKASDIGGFDALNDLNYNFVSSNKNGAMLIAHNEDEAIELTKSYFEKLDNNEPIDIPVRDF